MLPYSYMTDEIMKKLKDHDDHFASIDGQLDLIAITVVNHTQRLDNIEENMVTKQDHQEVMKALDQIIKLHVKTDQEITFLGHRVKRLEDATQNKPLMRLAV